MKINLNFDPQVFAGLVGGRPVIESPRLKVHSVDEARLYLKAYGYDLEQSEDVERLWQIHARAVVYLRTQMLVEGESLPSEISDRKQIGDICNLLVLASIRETEREGLTRWACGILRVMHVISQLRNDLFSHFSLEIQEEIFKPYRQVLHIADPENIVLSDGVSQDEVVLKQFDTKPFKDSDSSITKLLAKPDEVAFGLMDKVGVRFVTHHLFDVFRVMRFLVERHVVSTANIIPNQSNNTLYPINLFLETVESMPRFWEGPVEELDLLLNQRLNDQSSRAQYLEKRNVFTSKDYRFVKFITRQLVRVTLPEGQRSFSFFYPYEVQIMDYQHYLRSQSGPASHEEYKARQRARARSRVLDLAPP